MLEADPNGYYRVLGISTKASSAEIKVTYRRLAKELHPDTNGGRDTTSAFQAVQEAYSVLGDDGRRAEYDAFASIPDSGPEVGGGSYRPVEPIRCSECHSISAQPRFKVFYLVISYLFGSYKKPIQGVFCSACEFKAALKATGGTLVLGWWSLIGVFWTLHALFHNLVGGRFLVQNAFLQGQQAFYFAQQAELALAGASARGALGVAEKASRSSEAAKHGDALSALMSGLEGLIQSLPGETQNLSFKKPNDFLNKRFLTQFSVLTLGISIVGFQIYAMDQSERAAESLRLERAGIAKAEADAIAAQQEATLRAAEKPLPRSGVHYSLYGRSQEDWPPMRINNAPGANALVKLISLGSDEEVLSVFVRAGETVDVRVPLGSYRGKIASGETWYGDEIRFGPSTSYGEFGSLFEFRIEGDRLAGKEITLTRVENGNLSQSSISADQF